MILGFLRIFARNIKEQILTLLAKRKMKTHHLLPILSLCLILCGMWTSCKGKMDIPLEEVLEDDTLEAETETRDSIPEEELVIPPKKADELFDDFAFAFMKNPYFQKERTNFPLPYTIDKERKHIDRKAWTFDKMYSEEEVYTLIFDNIKEEAMAKDTTLKSVTVEEINIDTHRTKAYRFKKTGGEWRLIAMEEKELGESENSDFYGFYQRFATDSTFQRAHIEDPLPFSTFDDDIFEVVDGVISADQFQDFAPKLPKQKITNILYGQGFRNSRFRILSIRALSSGMESNMQFRKNADGEWMLTRLEN